MRMFRSICCILFCTVLSLIAVSSAETGNMTADEHYLMGNAFSAFGQYENATKEYQIALEMRPHFSDALNNLVIALNRQGKFNESLIAAENATRYSPDDPEVWYNRGYTLGMLGRYEDEIDSYKQALSIRPNFSSAWKNMGTAYFDMGRYPDAVDAFINETRYDPENAIAWFYLGTVYEKMNKIPDAISSYEKAQSIQPNLTIVNERLNLTKNNLTSKDNKVSEKTVNNSKTEKKEQPLDGILGLLGRE